MMLQFYKMTGSGNDFVMVDNRDLSLSSVLTRENIADICDRRFGVGADGLIAVEPARFGADACIRCYDSAGGESGMNGDAALCFTAFVDFLMEGDLPPLRFESPAGVVQGVVNEDDTVTVQLPEPGGQNEAPFDTPCSGPALIVFRGEVIICEE